MPTTSLPKPIWVARPADLERMIADLARLEFLAVDTESNSLFAYHERVCLIQFSTGERDYLLDPLALTDLSSLAPIFADPKIGKIFHASEYDLICLKRDFGIEVVNLFDTMLAARILGKREVGLGAILEEYFEITLNKRFQRANWGQRPLPPELLSYARLDTAYLISLQEQLIPELQAMGRWELAQEEFRRACRVEVPNNGERDATNYLRVTGGTKLTPREMTILVELCRYREQRAESANVPPFKVLDNHRLVQLAQSAPKTPTELAECGALTPFQLNRHTGGILAAIQHGLKAPLYKLPPRPPRPDARYLNRLGKLRDWRKTLAEKLGVESDIILPKDTMDALARENPTTPARLAELMAEFPWRLEQHGEEILKLLNK